MAETVISKRNSLLLGLAGFLFGAHSIMLWLGRWKLALVYFAVWLLIVALYYALPMLGIPNPMTMVDSDPSTGLGIISILLSIAGIVHALRVNGQTSLRPWYARWYVALIAPTAFLLVLALATRTFVYQPFSTPSESSVPNLLVGDYMMVSKSAYSQSEPQRGDIAVFKLPSDPSIDYVKRVVGLPGDRIQMISGVLHINGVAVKLEPVDLPDEFKTSREMTFQRETLPEGRSYVIANIGDMEEDNTQEYVVPEGHYFALGDNRDNSQDSRYLDAVGYIPRENFVGPYAFRFWTSNAVPLTSRPQEIYPAP